MTRVGLIGACAAWLICACDVATVPHAPSTIARNECVSDADCAGGECAGTQCRARDGTFQTLLFEVTPPANSDSIAGVQFLKTIANISTTGSDLDLELDPVSKVSGEATAKGRKCAPQFLDDNGNVLATSSDSSVPALISFIPTTRALGLYSAPSVVESELVGQQYFGFSLNVPPGQYDIYVEPRRQPDDACPMPPQLLRANQISGTLSLEIKLPEPSVFELHVTWPLADGGLNGWSVDMLDPVSGRVISNRATLALSAKTKTDYVASVSYFPVAGDATEAKAGELLRLSPPDGLALPTVLAARSALGLFSANSGTLSQFTALPTSVKVQGQVTALVTPNPVAATVTLIATKITGIDPGVLASYVRTMNVGRDGKFEVDLLPGTYNVSAAPTIDTTLAEVTEEWVVASQPSVQGGKVIPLSQALTINGRAVDTSNQPVATALVQAIASPASIPRDVLHQSLGESVYVPRATNANVSSGGDFALSADSGTFDVAVRPDTGTGYGWLLLPSVHVDDAGLGLGTQVLPLSVAYSGLVTVPGTTDRVAVPGALIRAYVYMKGGVYTADAAAADSVLQVAETRADKDGSFTALIPATLNAAPTAR